MELTRPATAEQPFVQHQPETAVQPAEEPLVRLQRVFERCGDGLYRFILVRVGYDRHAADDLVQQVCVEAARKRRIPEDDEQCEAWMFGIARNRIRKHWRRLRRKGVRLESEDAAVAGELVAALQDGPLPPESLARREAVTQLMLAVTALPAADQKLLFACYFDGRSHADIAAETDVSPKGIEMRLYRIRMRLRSMLGQEP